MTIHVKFASSRDVFSVDCVGGSLSLQEFKDAVWEKKFKVGRRLREAIDFRVFYADTMEEVLNGYRICKNSSMVVKRLPFGVLNGNTTAVIDASAVNASSKSEGSVLTKSVSSEGFVSLQLPPPRYVCHRCRQPGHFIQHCPTNGDPAFDKRRTQTRVSSSFSDVTIVSNKSIVSTSEDRSKCISAGKPVIASELIPPHLQCLLCKDLFKDVVMVRCCGCSFCDDCVKTALTTQKRCPNCGSEKCKDTDLLPNLQLRLLVDAYLNSSKSDVTLSSSRGSNSSGHMQQRVGSDSGFEKASSKAASHPPTTSLGTLESELPTRAYDSGVSLTLSRKRKPLVIELHGAKKIKPLQHEEYQYSTTSTTAVA